ncbi:MAG: alanine racemase [Clostridia bacterium]|nr:alanine racemase [Clostridia bacterium]
MAERFPQFTADLGKLHRNAGRILKLCEPFGVKVTAVTKGFSSIPECCRSLFDAGCDGIASSRMDQIRRVKEYDPSIPAMLIRIPMFSELEDVVRYADSSLVSEVETLDRLNAEAERQGRTHRVILMRDLGDLREGFFDRDALVKAAAHAERDLGSLILYGVGTNLSCYGSIVPTAENLTELALTAEAVEREIGRKLDIVSGGATTTLPVLLRGEVPPGINHLRLGECLFCPPTAWDEDLPGMERDVFQIRAQIVEINSKPTFPIGERGKAAFGKVREYEDLGVRKRAIVALGNQDMGDAKGVLRPVDPGIRVLGASGDHTILDIEDSETEYRLGGIITFNTLYQGCVYSSMSPNVSKVIIKRSE